MGAYYWDVPDFIYPETPQGISEFAFYVRKNDSWTYAGTMAPSLEGRSLGAINDYSYSVELDAYIEKYRGDTKRIQILSGDNAIDNNVKKLVASRIDTFIEDRP